MATIISSARPGSFGFSLVCAGLWVGGARAAAGRVFGVCGVWEAREELGAGRADELAHGFAPVTAEIVHDDDVAGAKRGHEDLLDIGSKALAVDWPLKQPRRLDPIVAQRGQECCGLPVTVRDLGREPAAARRPSSQRRHVGLSPGLVDEDQALRLDAILMLCPLRPPPRDVGTVAFASHHAFFLKLSFSAWTNSQTER
jgi:hypothetical protein